MIKRILLLLILMITVTTSVYGLKECGKSVEPSEIPCLVTSLWNYTTPCNQWNATVYNASGINVKNYTFQDLKNIGLCYYQWNLTELGSYIYVVENGDSGNITIGADNMIIASIIGIGIIVAIFIWLAMTLDTDHFLLKVLLILTSVTLLSLIPVVLVNNDISAVFHKAYQYFIRTFWVYVSVYFTYKVLIFLGVVIPKGDTSEQR